MASIAEPYFRFLDLPKELRLLVYENLPITESRFQVSLSYERPSPPSGRKRSRRSSTIEWVPEAAALLISSTLPVAILATSRLVNEEARDIIFGKTTLAKITPRVLVDEPHPLPLETIAVTLFLKRIIWFRKRAKDIGLEGERFEYEIVSMEEGRLEDADEDGKELFEIRLQALLKMSLRTDQQDKIGE
ncbi:hypothetical protein BDV96DRAFT_687558 [Lophiotrema nucula]|uniref:F-box domain-containing protein n=1 Tax=Lophiotrema nucula TaxID=690887 RepID=A0A6A5Z5L8_9PLEO|nr:hypothetical protein BDV96DRAFT_687558 [Lophiotrema nucula]